MSEKNLTVMVVEDEPLLLDAITRKLNLSAITAIPCKNGKVAFDWLQANETVPDAIWLDYYLPDMNGFEFMQALKSNPRLTNIPVIVVSNSANEKKVQSMMQLGVKQYILKADHRLDDIITIIRDFVKGESQ